MPRPESGLGCLMCVIFTRKRRGVRQQRRLALPTPPRSPSPSGPPAASYFISDRLRDQRQSFVSDEEEIVIRTFTGMPRPESDLECLIRAILTRKRRSVRQQRRLALIFPLALRRPGVRLVQDVTFWDSEHLPPDSREYASEPKGNNLKDSTDRGRNAKAKIWPWLS
jgi:hypothetical protein